METYTTTSVVKLQPSRSSKKKLGEIIKRDTHIINYILKIMNKDEEEIFKPRKYKGYMTTRTKLNNFFIPTKNRPLVKYDLKRIFPNISNNELQECLGHAKSIYLSYLNLEDIQRSDRKPPKLRNYISRNMGTRRFSVDTDNNEFSTMYSCKTNLKIRSGDKTRVIHDRISIPYLPYEWGQNNLHTGEIKAAQITRRDNTYYANIIIDIETESYTTDTAKPLGIIGIDLGIRTTASVVLLTKHGIEDTILLRDDDIKNRYAKVEQKIASLQNALELRSPKRYLRIFHDMASKVNNARLSDYMLHLNRQIKRNQISTNMIDTALKLNRSNKVNPKYQGRIKEKLEQLRHMIVTQKLGVTHNIGSTLKKYLNTRRNLKNEMINQLNFELQQFIEKHMKKFDLYIVIGRPNGINFRYKRGSGNRRLRKVINEWAYASFQKQLQHNLAKIGLSNRYIEVNESWTSKKCYKCNKQGVRPKQDKFYCSNYNCKNRIHADLNGAANIAKRGIKKRKLLGTKQSSKWNIPILS